MQNITILGSTGSVGVNTLDVIDLHPEQFKIIAITANNNVELLLKQCLQYSPKYAVMVNEDAACRLRKELALKASSVTVLSSPVSLEFVASLEEVNTVVAAIVGIAGLRSVVAAAKSAKKILLANKEALVTAGSLLMSIVKNSGAVLLPVDSEHNAVFQSLPFNYSPCMPTPGVRRILLTASGGPFRNSSLEFINSATPEQAVAHPNWTMGQKISVDSATMMNKGLEVIEAYWLFSVPLSRIEVVIHPQSIIHSMVEYDDGSVLAQLGNPDMRTPIAHALAYPNRIVSGANYLDFTKIAALSFEAPDHDKFPCLRMAYEAIHTGGAAVIALNAANEIAVQEFLNRRIKFINISSVIKQVVAQTPNDQILSIDDVERIDSSSRQLALSACINYL